MTAVLVAKSRGLRTLVLEKSARFGGLTALPGGRVWVSGAAALARHGYAGREAVTLLRFLTQGFLVEGQLRACLRQGRALLDFLKGLGQGLKFTWKPGYSAYFPTEPAGLAHGPSLNVEPISLPELGVDLLRLQLRPAVRGFGVISKELRDLHRLPTRFKPLGGWVEDGRAVRSGAMLRDLAAKIEVDSDDLERTAAGFQTMSQRGVDAEFHQGENPYDNYYDGPALSNPNLAEAQKVPFWPFLIVRGDLRLKGGAFVKDEYACVLRADGPRLTGPLSLRDRKCRSKRGGQELCGPRRENRADDRVRLLMRRSGSCRRGRSSMGAGDPQAAVIQGS